MSKKDAKPLYAVYGITEKEAALYLDSDLRISQRWINKWNNPSEGTNIETVADLLGRSEEELLSFSGCEPRAITELYNGLSFYGLENILLPQEARTPLHNDRIINVRPKAYVGQYASDDMDCNRQGLLADEIIEVFKQASYRQMHDIRCNPGSILERRIQDKQFDDVPEGYFEWQQKLAATLAEIWDMRVTLDADTLLGRLVMAVDKPFIYTAFRLHVSRSSAPINW